MSPADTLILEFWPPELEDDELPLLKPVCSGCPRKLIQKIFEINKNLILKEEYMYINGKMRPVEIIPGLGAGRRKENDGGGVNSTVIYLIKELL
jgi:hypothetical protein